MINHLSNYNFILLNSSIYPCLSIALIVVQDTIFTSMLGGEELEKDLFVTIVNEK